MFAGTKIKKVASTPFSDFISNASSAEKKKVYKVVLERATVRQQWVLRKAAAAKATHSERSGKVLMEKTHLPKGLDGRARDQHPPKAGQIREKRADTKVETLRKEYGPGFAAGFRSDAHLGTVREKTGKSLHQLAHESKKSK